MAKLLNTVSNYVLTFQYFFKLLLVVGTVMLDLKTFLLVKLKIAPDQVDRPKIDKIPYDASMISTTILFPYLFYTAILGDFIAPFSPLTKFYLIMISSTTVNLIRIPAAGLYYIFCLICFGAMEICSLENVC